MNTYNTERDAVDMRDGADGWQVARPDSDAKTWAVAAHLSNFVAWGPIGPVVVWLLGRHRHRFVDEHGREAVNFQISLLIWYAILAVATLLSVGVLAIVTVPAGIALLVANVILSIIAAVQAGDGKHYRYPLTFRFV